ncbi:hypothetical protein [Selenomonas ruminantium]|uniref:hypothetical protein n=1 Tax=Selenomonas ruminantium TaxID=971 RepID=UPI0026F28E2B|nr:hypothetical protein [Selenomonas ruminantium]
MEDGNLEEKLGAFDFSVFSKVRDSLRFQLLAMQRQNDGREQSWRGFLTDEDLEFITAAKESSCMGMDRSRKASSDTEPSVEGKLSRSIWQ